MHKTRAVGYIQTSLHATNFHHHAAFFAHALHGYLSDQSALMERSGFPHYDVSNASMRMVECDPKSISKNGADW